MKDVLLIAGRALLASLLLLGGCSSLALVEPPIHDTHEILALPSAGVSDGVERGIPHATWWTQFADPQLEELIRLAWQNNHELRIAAARLANAREHALATQGARWPGVALEGGASRARLAGAESRNGEPGMVSPVQLQLLLTWELDLFGRIRNSIDASRASAEEKAATRDDVRRLILAHVTQAYFDLRGAQMLRTSLQGLVDNQADTLKLVREREVVGSIAPAERMRAEAQLRLVSSRLPAVAAQERAARNRLATLTGQRLDASMLSDLDTPMALQIPQRLVTDEPARLLLRRPDVRAAERAVAAAAAREGIAYADLFPRISLSALLGSLGVAGDWLGGDAIRWRSGGLLSLPLFDGGAGRAHLRAAGADVEAARANLDKVIAVALEEADTAISSWTQLLKRSQELDTAHGLAQEGARLARLRFREGAESLLGVLESERIALAAEEQRVLARRDLALAIARCYVAVAGGFDIRTARQEGIS